ncbi:cytochrome d ubiquinol oxidase subunit II [Leifsonia poae]|uniref:Cytochrome c oxidase assembly protein n=1 Tax=Leifsonia poae TaxID=110933 RepID=A0A9W6H9Q3_9MICO|nr:cytochrome d ubiquinol oxidase subunit II [Leifsonia poae]GLJ76150.1 cytochrome c oxidase assembly protein [Leifsonia poae]
MNLADLWFIIIAVFWTGFFVLEGFDFGVGAIHSVIGRSDTERRVAINTVGPFWDGNEVWLVVGAAAIFAAFPAWYATWISASYLAIVLLLVALIVRGISFEWRGRGRGDGWRWGWSLCLTLGSIVAPTVLGIALGDLVAGLPIDSDGNFTGDFASLFTGLGVWTGLTMLALCLLQGSTFLALRTTDAVRGRARRFGHVIGFVDLAMVAVFGLWMALVAHPGPGGYAVLAVALLAVLASLIAQFRARDGLAFSASSIAIAAVVASLFVSLYPNVLVSSTSASNSLTVAGSASGDYALSVMSIVALVCFPIVLLYQAYSYVVFRRRVAGPPPTAEPSTTESAAAAAD